MNLNKLDSFNDDSKTVGFSYDYSQLPQQWKPVWFNLSSYPLFYQEFVKDLESYRSRISYTEYNYALGTILALAILEKNVDEFMYVTEERDRNFKMTEKVILAVEAAFSKGETPEEIKNSILGRIENVKRVYFRAKELDSLYGFFRDAFVGAPCFNGRLISVEGYERTQLDLQEYFWGRDDTLDPEAVQLEEIIYEYQLKYETEKIPDIHEFIAYLTSQPVHIANWDAEIGSEHFQKIYARAQLICAGGDL